MAGPMDGGSRNRTFSLAAGLAHLVDIHRLRYGMLRMSGRDGGWNLFAVIMTLTVLGTACAGETKPSHPSSQETSGPSSDTEDGSGQYVGPKVAFDVPTGWHEFYLEVSYDFFAAYGPEAGGESDYVAVAPLPRQLAEMESEKILEALIGTESGIRIEVVDIGDRSTSTAVVKQDDVRQQATLVEGLGPPYLVTCQSSSAMADDIEAGCAAIIASLRASEPSPVTDASGCTDRELSLIASVPLLEGAEPASQATVYPKACDLQVELPSGSENAVATLRAALLDAGWHPNDAKVVRRSGQYDVWRLIADRDFDVFQIEAFVKGDIADRYFITVVDG